MRNGGDDALSQTARVALPAAWYAASFLAHKKNCGCGGNFSVEVCRKWATQLRRAARNSELMHSQLEGGPLHSKMCRCPIRARHNPIALLESFKNLLTFRFLQNVAKCAIC